MSETRFNSNNEAVNKTSAGHRFNYCLFSLPGRTRTSLAFWTEQVSDALRQIRDASGGEDVLPAMLSIWDLEWLIGKREEMWSHLHTKAADLGCTSFSRYSIKLDEWMHIVISSALLPWPFTLGYQVTKGNETRWWEGRRRSLGTMLIIPTSY